MAKRVEIIMQRTDDGRKDMVVLTLHSPDGEDMTAQQIVDAVSESLLLNWGEETPSLPEGLDS